MARGSGSALVLLALAAAAAAGAEPGWLSTWGAGLRDGLGGALQPVLVEYEEPLINTSYVSRSEFDMRAMGHLYNSTKYIIDIIANKQAYPEDTVSVEDGHVEIASLQEHWRALALHYAGPAAVLATAALLAAALPLAGLFWCCCHWCRAGRRRPFDRKYDACVKGLLAILLIALLTLFLFGVVCAFATEEQLERGTRGTPRALRQGSADAQAFLNATQAHARHLLVRNYRQLHDKLKLQLDSMGTQVSEALAEFSRAVSVSTLHRMVLRLADVQADLRRVHNATAELRFNAERLHAGLSKVRFQLLQTLKDCEQAPCRRLQEKHRIGQLDTQIQYNQMPDVSALLRNVTALLESDLQQEVAAGQQVVTDIQRGIADSVSRHIPAVLEQLARIGARLEAAADQITFAAGNASLWLHDNAGAAADSAQHGISVVAPWRRLAGLCGALALLAALALLSAGLLCGVCGKRPDVYRHSDCCSKAAGARCLLCGMGVMFLAGGGVALLLAAYFTVGVVSQRFLCDPLTEPHGNRLFDDVERFVSLEKVLFNERRDPDFNFSSVMRRCHDNYTIYETLHLHRLYDLQALRSELESQLEQQVASLVPGFPQRHVRILSPRALDRLQRLADSGLADFNYDVILDALEQNITSLSLDSLAATLSTTSAELQSRAQYTRVAAELRNAADSLATYHTNIVLPLLHRTAEVNTTVRRLRDALRFGHPSVHAALDQLTKETQHAELFLSEQGPALVQNLTHEFGLGVAAPLRQYLDRVESAATGRPREGAGHDAVGTPAPLGRCGPLSAAFNATRDSACRNLLMPINGYWIALSWCVLLFVPLLVLAQRLSRLYRQLEPYPGPLVEAEYLYDAYADRDNVPLANAYKAEKRSRRSPRGGSGGGGGSGGTAAAAGAGAGGAGGEGNTSLDAHHARRYNDMAPKHWEEGPPRYHGPTEYERPPPYYYPGPVDRQ